MKLLVDLPLSQVPLLSLGCPSFVCLWLGRRGQADPCFSFPSLSFDQLPSGKHCEEETRRCRKWGWKRGSNSFRVSATSLLLTVSGLSRVR